MAQKLSYNGQVIYDFDHDRFLTVLFAPSKCREALFALYAFNYEIAKTRSVVSDVMIGNIRLQWWRDEVDKLYAGQVVDHEALKGLVGVTGLLDKEDFYSLIDAREMDLTEEAPQTLDDLVDYADKTSTLLTSMACQIIGGEVDEEVVRAVSIAYSLTGILRAVPYHVSQGRFMLPLGLLEKHGISPEIITDKNASDILKPIVKEIYFKVLKYINLYKGKKSNSGLMIGVLAQSYARAIKRNDFNVFIGIKTPFVVWYLVLARLLKRL